MTEDTRTQIGKGPWRVECDDAVLRVASRESAEWNRANIEKRGYCRGPHRILDPEGHEVSSS